MFLLFTSSYRGFMKIGKYLTLAGLCISLITGCQDKDEQREPGVQTFNANDASDYSIKLNGIVDKDYGDLVTERGFCWSALPNVDISDSIVFSGNGLGMYSARLEGLPKYKTFYFRAFAKNSGGTSYGEEYPFKAEEIPHKFEIMNIGYSQLSGIATIWYNLTEGSQIPISHGICYGPEPSPTINNTVKEIGTSQGGGFVQIDDLEPDNIYYLRIYVRYFTGVQYSEDVQIITY